VGSASSLGQIGLAGAAVFPPAGDAGPAIAQGGSAAASLLLRKTIYDAGASCM
jgi:hypothetical protein